MENQISYRQRLRQQGRLPDLLRSVDPPPVLEDLESELEKMLAPVSATTEQSTTSEELKTITTDPQALSPIKVQPDSEKIAAPTSAKPAASRFSGEARR